MMATRGYTGLENPDAAVDPDYPQDHRRDSVRQSYHHPVEIILDFEDRDWTFNIIPGALRRPTR